MPDKKYWDKKEQKEVILLSDYFVCNRCLGEDFSYEHNYLFDSSESTKKYKQICLRCGEIFFSDKKYQEEKSRYELVEEKKARERAEKKEEKIKEMKEAVKKDREKILVESKFKKNKSQKNENAGKTK